MQTQTEQDRVPGAALLRRLGFSGEPPDLGFSRRLILVLLGIYAVFFIAFYPAVPANHDEANYIRQALLVLAGQQTISQVDAFTGESHEETVSTYAIGTALLASPFVAAVGRRGAFVVACLALVAAVLLTARCIRELGYPPVFSLLLLGFPPALVLGRAVMSDVPSAAWVALGLWFFWHGVDRGRLWWFASGFVAGSSLVFRPSNPLLFAPLFAGTLLRRETKCWALVAGGLLGVAMRFLSMRVFFGNALLERSYYAFSPDTIGDRLPVYLIGMLIFIPGGLVFSLCYRGRRRVEVVTTIVLFFCFYLFQLFSTIETSFSKRLVLALRYFIPLVPMMALAMSEAVPRLWQQLLDRTPPPRRAGLQRLGAGLVVAWLAGVGVASAAVHPVFSIWGATQAEIRAEIDRLVPDDAVLVTNLPGTKKFIRYIDRYFLPVDRYGHTPEEVLTLLDRHRDVYVVLFDRTDSSWWRSELEKNAAFAEGLREHLQPLSDVQATASDRLRIWRLVPKGWQGSSPPG